MRDIRQAIINTERPSRMGIRSTEDQPNTTQAIHVTEAQDRTLRCPAVPKPRRRSLTLHDTLRNHTPPLTILGEGGHLDSDFVFDLLNNALPPPFGLIRPIVRGD